MSVSGPEFSAVDHGQPPELAKYTIEQHQPPVCQRTHARRGFLYDMCLHTHVTANLDMTTGKCIPGGPVVFLGREGLKRTSVQQRGYRAEAYFQENHMAKGGRHPKVAGRQSRRKIHAWAVSGTVVLVQFDRHKAPLN